ncbi:MAG: 5-(carboxyamino)imidazole ribonucleotide synthase [Cenarchaeum sp. SB0661_bin_35]|nr:5-(carboxyamino)imidazole ribonucleotide synthase [Cenarchaeum sp. SB0667_bin_13]MYB46830.1 5-(carboxyamino)imidazole ribonucleotide synthase [Cenarchaeum sp. SB0662_bin_33]MYC79301.1 5-(carboxyamino)imidazole ribonucleotide synthase [Cenarchaeum sp. SB0661_bin_35]MYI52062.1 5-(carboxyamino)imidazole ribonucleotide synthase [Cenarchaeum sp. SB0673_bin_9]MYJ27587.1 5-(carboxyamino)imidazole ribonucleotide synthase [Cenarchaeum sp. SB0672_bin_9]
MSSVLGVIGGGQLGMMLTQASKSINNISKVVVLDPTHNCPAAQVGAEQIQASFDDDDAIRRLASLSDVITYEIESGDSYTLESLQDVVEINPSPQTLRIIQDKYKQKKFLAQHGMPIPDFEAVSSYDDIVHVASKFDYPVLLKARRGGYDGRGNYRVNSIHQIQEALDYFGNTPLMIEKFVPYMMEISVIISRNIAGQIEHYTAVENIHEHNILRQTISPARIPQNVADKAADIAMNTVNVLQGAGVFGIEMFLLDDHTILINEIAPRVHNSGHHTMHSAETSQFEQHIRAVLDMDLGSTKLHGPAVMYNILGSSDFTGEYRYPQISHPASHLVMYGKKISKPLRKLGHLNIHSADNYTVSQLLDILESIKPQASISPIY